MKNFVVSIMIVGVTVFSFAAMLFVGCGSPDKLGQGGSGGGISGTVVVKFDANPNSQAGSGGGGNTGAPPTPDGNCGSTTSSTQHVPADVLLVLDRSGSMDYSTTADSNCANGAANCTARWPALTSAVDATLTATSGSINWGLKLFSSSGNGCTVNNGVEVAVSATSVANIQTLIGNTSPGGNTPTAQTITAATAYLKTVNDGNNHVILLATDGEPNCAPGGQSGTANVQGTIDAITAAKTAGFLVYVIGIGPSVGNLDNFAVAGGTANYYPASSPQALADAFSSISKAVTTCSFTSRHGPARPQQRRGLPGQEAWSAKTPANGWSFGANNQTIVLNGSHLRPDHVRGGVERADPLRLSGSAPSPRPRRFRNSSRPRTPPLRSLQSGLTRDRDAILPAAGGTRCEHRSSPTR